MNKWMGAIRPISCELNVLLEMREEGSHVDGFYIGGLNGEMVASLVVSQIADGLKYMGLLMSRSGFDGLEWGRECWKQATMSVGATLRAVVQLRVWNRCMRK